MTVVIGLDDTTPGQVYVYVGTKTGAGNDFEKAGLMGGTMYGVRANGLASEQACERAIDSAVDLLFRGIACEA